MLEHEVTEAYERYSGLVLRRCQRVLGEKAAAYDVLQEVFLKLWRYGDAFREAESKLAWLYRVADRCCFNRMDRLSHKPSEELDQVPEELVALASHAQSAEDKELVLKFLSRLDDSTRQVAVLRYLDGLTQEEIARALGLSRGTIVNRLQLIEQRATQWRLAMSRTLKGPEVIR